MFAKRRKELDAAQQELKQNPTPQGYVALIERCVALGALDRARAVAKRGRERFPNSERIQQALQNVVRLERETEICTLQRRLEASSSRGDYERLVAIYLTELGNRSRAYELALRGLERFPEADGLHLAVGQIRLERFLTDGTAHDFGAARASLEEARRLNPQNFKARLLLGRLLAVAGQCRAAAETLGPLVQESGDPYAERLCRVVMRHAGEMDLMLDEVLRRIETQGAWPPARDEVEEIFERRPPPALDAGEVRQFLDGLKRIAGFRAAAVVGPKGDVIGVRGASLAEEEDFAPTVDRIARSLDEATTRMDMGGFHSGELLVDGGETIYLAFCRGYTLGLRGTSEMRRTDAAGAMERFVGLADAG